MEQPMIKKLESLSKGEIIPIILDICAKILFGSLKNKDITALLVASILEKIIKK